MLDKKEGYRGYVTCREFGGLKLPVPVQSQILREYCLRKGFIYKLHLNENIFPHSYMVLEGILENLTDFEGLLMCSIFMLPERSSRRKAIYEKILSEKISIHFILEEIVCKDVSDTLFIEEILRAHYFLKYSTATL
jgi:sporadic carbohydrate cluster protein (TIGR04323 family)